MHTKTSPMLLSLALGLGVRPRRKSLGCLALGTAASFCGAPGAAGAFLLGAMLLGQEQKNRDALLLCGMTGWEIRWLETAGLSLALGAILGIGNLAAALLGAWAGAPALESLVGAGVYLLYVSVFMKTV